MWAELSDSLPKRISDSLPKRITERENSMRRRDGEWSGRAGAWKKTHHLVRVYVCSPVCLWRSVCCVFLAY